MSFNSIKQFVSFQFLLLISVSSLFSCSSEKTDASLDFKNAHESYVQGELDSAMYYYHNVLKVDSNHLPTLNELADIYFVRAEIGKALRLLERSSNIDSTNADIQLKIAEINLLLGKYKEAFQYINNGLRIDDRKPKAYFMKGVAYKHIKDTVKAISSFKTATELEEEYSQVYYELGLLLTLQGDSLAIEYYKRGLKVSPTDVGLKLSLAWAYDQFGFTKEANESYFQALKESPDFPDGKYNYAIFKRREGELDTALMLCNEALVHDTSNFEVLNLKGLILYDLGRVEEAAEVKDILNNMESKFEL